MKISVEIPPYCHIPHNKIKCRFLVKKFGGKKECSLFRVRVYNAVDTWKAIILPCAECKKNRSVDKELK